MKFLITGGAGFIGSALVRYIIKNTNDIVINVDKLTYAGNLESLSEVENNERYVFEKVDICDGSEVSRLFEQYHPDAVIHLAAESHVDRSIDSPVDFIQTNIIGTYNLLEASLDYWRNIKKENNQSFRLHHVSTDEVFGSLGTSGYFNEESSYQPNSPYSASKASSDHLVRAWYHTYGLPTVITNCSNNYGPCQFPEKLIPLIIHKALNGEPLPVYGKGDQVRDWLYVEDHVDSLYTVCTTGKTGETYNIGGNNEKTNLDVVRAVCALLDELAPNPEIAAYSSLISFVEDRPGHDQRYAIDAGKIQNELDWKPKESFDSGLRKTVQWYLQHQGWCQNIINDRYRGERLGMGKKVTSASTKE